MSFDLPLWARILIGIAIILVLFAVFIWSFLLNKKTKVPDGCPKETIGCGGCMLACQVREEDVSMKKIGDNLTNGYHKEETKTEEKNEEKKEGK
jgi:hypothetical protein